MSILEEAFAAAKNTPAARIAAALERIADALEAGASPKPKPRGRPRKQEVNK